MQNLIFLIACLGIGIYLKQAKILQNEATQVINSILLYICLPAATLLHTSQTRFDSQYIFPMLMPWILFIGSFVFFQVLDKFLKFEAQTKAVLILTAGIPSVSFVGFPIFEMLYGKQGLEIGILMSQSGSFLVCSTLGVMLASYYAEAQANFKQIALNVIKFPTFIAFCIAIALNVFDVPQPEIIKNILEKLAAPFSFLALISVGLQIPFNAKGWQKQHLKWGLFYKLVFAPLFIFLLYQFVFKQKGIMFQTSFLGAALGPMNTIAIIAANYKLNPSLASQMVGLGIPLSLLGVLLLQIIV